jgi:hypothetical protein
MRCMLGDNIRCILGDIRLWVGDPSDIFGSCVPPLEIRATAPMLWAGIVLFEKNRRGWISTPQSGNTFDINETGRAKALIEFGADSNESLQPKTMYLSRWLCLRFRSDRLRVGPFWEGCRESRRCSRDTYPGSYITNDTRIRKNSSSSSVLLDLCQPAARVLEGLPLPSEEGTTWQVSWTFT